MIKKYIAIFLGITLLVLLLGFLFLPKKVPQQSEIETKGILLGISGYVPTNYPSPSIFDMSVFWKEINRYQIYGIHNNWEEVETIGKLSKTAKLPVDLVIGFQVPSDWSKNSQVIGNLRKVLDENSNIKYVGIGNEINIIQKTYPKDFPKFISSFKEISLFLKNEYPRIKVFTTFQYDALRGKSMILGNGYSKVNWEILKNFDDNVDFYGFTIYPFLQYKSVNEIPKEYITEIFSKTDKQIAVTEVGWPTQSNIVELKSQKFVFNQEEQASFYKLLEGRLADSNRVLFITTPFLNDLVDWTKNDNTGSPLFDSIGLRSNLGQPKQAFSVWNNWAKVK